MEEFESEIEKLKNKFNENAPMFRGKNEIIIETCYQLLSKAADFMTITSRKESDLTQKQ
jgi:hypothetical protein